MIHCGTFRYRSPEGLRAWQDELKRAADYRRNQVNKLFRACTVSIHIDSQYFDLQPSESDIEAAAALERRQELVQRTTLLIINSFSTNSHVSIQLPSKCRTPRRCIAFRSLDPICGVA
jgi:hypothetical protein